MCLYTYIQIYLFMYINIKKLYTCACVRVCVCARVRACVCLQMYLINLESFAIIHLLLWFETMSENLLCNEFFEI